MSSWDSPSGSKPVRILVVDDVADNSFLLETILQAEGYHVEVASNGKAALAKIQESPPDLVLLDIMMPGMDGYEVARRIRQDSNLSAIGILMLTGYDELNESEPLNGVSDGFIRKPIKLDELLNQVRTTLTRDNISKTTPEICS